MNSEPTPQNTLAFLRCILPPEADDWYCCLVLDGQSKRQFFFKTIEELASCMLFHDRQGRTVYHACATFKTNQTRKAWNASRARSAWLDLDAGAGKAYPTAHAAAAALGQFCKVAGLPTPCLVGSGGGVHAYWPFVESVGAADWHAIGRGLKQLCVEHGLHVGPERTADIASVLRTPGTHNYKPELRGPDGSSPTVQLATTLREFSHSDLAAISRAGTPKHTERSHTHPRRTGRLIDAVEARSRADFPATYCDRIADSCAQVGEFRDRKALGEPRWYACVGVTAWATDGKVKTHEWCAHDPKYSEHAVDTRIGRVLALSGPTTCAKLESLNPGGCVGCPHRGKISSPIQLGHADPRAARPAAPAMPAGGTVVDGLPNLKPPFNWWQNGLAWQTEDKSGAPINVPITREPLYLVEVQRSEVGKPKYSYLFHHCLPHEGWKYVSVDAEHMYAANSMGLLAKQGIVIHDPKLFLRYVKDTVSDFHSTNATGIRYDQFGWKNGQKDFFCGRVLYTAGGKVTVQGGGEVQTRAGYFGPQRPGASLVVWTEAADALFGGASLPLGICVLASFAAPLMRLLLTVDGGCIIHLFSSTSGAGKSWALDGAWSVWGLKKGMMLVNDDTKVSKPIVMGTLGNLPICYDELNNKDAEVVRALVNLFSDGRDRLRGATDGTTRQMEATWCTLLLSNSNYDLLERLDTAGVDAPSFRVLQLLCSDIDFDKTVADALKRRLEDNAGTAGDRFLQYLVNPQVLASVRQMLEGFHQQLWKDTGLGNPQRYRVAAVACILVAAVITKHLDILHFDIERIRDYLVKELVDPANAGTVTGVKRPELAQARLSDFLNEHLGETLTVSDKFRPGRNVSQIVVLGDAPRNRVSLRYEVATNRIYISETVFKEWCQKRQISLRDIVGVLKQSGVVIDDKRRITLTAGTQMVGAQGITLELNAEHPALSGMVASIDRIVTGDKDTERK